ncbi:MAG: hypothetical protein PHF79_04020 [Candidatus Pacebacteria bacterium]|nr:hypothetical protein [Candidatus Paceibacterota bacterium]
MSLQTKVRSIVQRTRLSFQKKVVLPLRFPGVFRTLKNNESGATIDMDSTHLSLAIDWLKNTQNVSDCPGIPAVYDLLSNTWGKPYRETTGYIIPTFITYSKITGDSECLDRAVSMGDWEIEEQHPSGGIGEPRDDGDPGLKIFNTGQVILGWCALYDETKKQKYLDAASKAARWLMENQEMSGAWEKFSNNGPKTFDGRVAWALEEVSKRSGDKKCADAARRTIEWILMQQHENGWFSNTSLSQHGKPWTHLIAYTISGLWEYGYLKDDRRVMDAAEKSALALARHYVQLEKTKFLSATFDQNWQSTDNYSCLTGNAQLAFIWIRIFEKTKEELFLKAAEKMIEQMKGLQIRSTADRRILGGLTGSHPVSGPYVTYGIPNWGIKFFADMLIAHVNIKKGASVSNQILG